MSHDDHITLAEKLIAAIEAGDSDTVRTLYSDDCKIWHNFDQQEQSVDQNMATLAWMVKRVSNLRYEEIVRMSTDRGFIEQHVLRGTAPNGQDFEVPACIVGTVEGGRITRIEEYLDTAQVAPLLQRA
jgi:ketosteroid isomerase-like protein